MSITVKRSDRYPVGTSVGLYPALARIYGGKPSGTAVESANVASSGDLTVNPTEGVAYVLYAEVAGEHRYTFITGTTPAVEYHTIPERIAAKRTEVGA